MSLRLRIAEHRYVLGAKQANAVAEFHERRGWLVGVERDDTLLGLGEASPLPGYSSESFVETYDALRGFGAGKLVALEAALHEGRFEHAAAITAPMPASARFGVETAVLDALARARDGGLSARSARSGLAARSARTAQPMHRLLGAAPEAVLRPAMLIASNDTRDAGTIANEARRTGATALKLKIGRDRELELALARALRTHLPEVELRFDANRTLERGRDVDFVRALASLEPCLLEEPYGDSAFVSVAHERAAGFDLPIALDESLRLMPAVELDARLAAGSVAALVLKPTTLGLLGSLVLAAKARAHGVRAIASHTYEGVIGYAAAAELALALGEPAPGLDAHYLRDSLARWRLASRPNAETGELVRHDSPGIGVALDAFVGLPWS